MTMEATFKIFKTEFTKHYHFESLEELAIKLLDYINWFNNIRIYSTLGYLTPRQYKEHNLKKTVYFSVDNQYFIVIYH